MTPSERPQGAAPAAARRRDVLTGVLSRNSAFTRLWIGESASELGAQATLIAMPLLVLALTRSAADAGLVGAARTGAMVASVIPAGVFADRVDRRKLMIACSAARAAVIASVPLALALGRPPLAQLLLVAVLDAALSATSYVTERSLLPQLVPQQELAEAVTVNEARSAAATLAGPSAGGALFGLARAAPFLADLGSCVVELVSLVSLAVPLGRSAADGRGPQRRPDARAAFAEAWEGLRWLLAQRFLRAASLMYAAENVSIYALNLLGLLILRKHGVSSAGIGAAYAIIGAGGLLGALLANPLRRVIPARPAILLEPWVYALLMPLLLIVHSVVAVGVVVACMFVPMTLSTSIIVGRRLALTPERLRARVQASGSLIAVSLSWLGPLAVGLLVQYSGDATAVLALSGWALLTAAVATAAPALRTVPVAAAGVASGDA